MADPVPPDRSILPNGAEIHFKDDREIVAPDRIELLDSGWVMAVFKNQYEVKYYRVEDISGLHTYTRHLEGEDWW